MTKNLEIVQGAGETAGGLDPAVPFFGDEAERFRHRLDWSYEQAGPQARRKLEAITQVSPAGTGVEKIVYEFGSDKVVSLLAPHSPETASKDYSPDALKRTFYQRKLLHLLAPECVPDIHLAGTAPPILVLERVQRPAGKAEFLKAIDLRKQKIQNGERPLSALFALGVGIDPTGDNIILAKNGSTVYVDNPTGAMNKDVLEEAIAELPELKRRKALKYMDRLESLGAEFIVENPQEAAAESTELKLVA